MTGGASIYSGEFGRNIMDIIHDRAVGIDISKRDARSVWVCRQSVRASSVLP